MKKHMAILHKFHEDRSGAVLLLSLAAILIIMMLSWVIIDAGKSARDKIELQAAADAAAFSQASVKSRIMNMVAYTNVAKRSIIGIQAMYLGMWTGFMGWLLWRWSKCRWYRPDICIDALANTFLWFREFMGDYRQLTGANPLAAMCGGKKSCRRLLNRTFGFSGSGSDRSYHRRDLVALDNYQLYMTRLGVWWGYSESIVRGMRNGATTVSSFPVPFGQIIGPIPNLLQALKNALPSGLSGSFVGTGLFDEFPIERMSYRDLRRNHMHGVPGRTDPAYAVEHLANSLQHKRRSTMGAKSNLAYVLGLAAFDLGYGMTTDQMGRVGQPWTFKEYENHGQWTTRSSNLVLSYGNRPERFGDDRNKYGFMSRDYEHQLGVIDEVGYKASGYWSMARAEMSYQDGRPNPFRPSWTARMRPIALPGEWEEAKFDLNRAYHDMLPYLALSSLVGVGSGADLMASGIDFVNMERATRAFGHSTIDGVGK
ncbi:hypothetical protein FRD01_07355 [Microvenator marinus]|jgi:hypothetical protein|uniref:Putative Flp pilus-assembly TadG-like N-terminal domain-containing protein n=1 Tax=Microvenator marinus TaxID=2600177 RepID=A0A5B8XN65_9DELT|nr:pilus assembly protein TadG-related protein [Microvenator marinus]QED27060.1 hypothetical protein FRD01_07355 [Microvenator marinus]